MKKKNIKNIAIYQTSKGAIELRGDIAKETIWATQAQIADIFNIERSVITKHILKIENLIEIKYVQILHILLRG